MKHVFLLFLAACSVAFPLDLVFQDVELKEALTTLSHASGVPIIFPQDVTGRVSLKVYGVSLDTALNLLLTGTPYDWIKEDEQCVVVTRVGSDSKLWKLHSITLQHTSVEQVLPYLSDYKAYVTGIGENQLVIFSGERIFKEIEELVRQLDVEKVQKFVWYRYTRFTEEEKIELKRLLSLVPTVLENEIAVDEILKILSKERKERFFTGIVPLLESKESKMEITENSWKLNVAFLLQGASLRVKLSEGPFEVEAVVNVPSKKTTALLFQEGLLEIQILEVARVEFKREETKELKEKFAFVCEISIGKQAVLLAGASTEFLEDMHFHVLFGVSTDKPVLTIKLEDVKTMGAFLFSYGEARLIFGERGVDGGYFSIGVGFRRGSFSVGGGIGTDFRGVSPEVRLGMTNEHVKFWVVLSMEKFGINFGVKAGW